MPHNKPIGKSKQSSDMPVEIVWIKAGRKERKEGVGTGIPSFCLTKKEKEKTDKPCSINT